MSKDYDYPRWQRLKDIFNGALERQGETRGEYIRKECGGDRELMHEVHALLQAYDNYGAVDRSLERLKQFPISRMQHSAMIGKRIGPYRVVDVLGYGGMGTVYLAERADGTFDQTVALKLLRTGFESDEQVSRFRMERHILARLNHPLIARLYDGGITEDGQPYFAMEYVEGAPINEYCTTRNLPVRERLYLFLKICEAVQYAHGKLIVHRDLKPSNILVTGDGTVKLLDFGIAKALDAGAMFNEVVPHTKTGILPLTPTYASPEQILGAPVATSSDIYQLGVVLYELLTGVRPYEVSGKTPGEIESVICEEEPARPSAAAASSQSLRGDLDTIVMKMLHKETDRRYDSVDQLASDIRKHLAGRPVSAHPDSWIYRSRKFVRRHTFGVAAFAILVMLLSGYAITITLHSQRMQAALDQTQREADRAEQVTEFLMDMFQASDPSEALGDTITARELLQRGIDQAEQLSDRPVLQAQLFDVVGQVYGRLGMYDTSVELLEYALQVRKDHFGVDDEHTAKTKVHLANNMRRTGRHEDAATLLEEAVAIQRKIFNGDHADLAYTLSILGGVWMEQARLDESLSALREALAMQRRVYDSDNLEITETLNILALLFDERGDLDDAIRYMHEALDIRRTLLNENDPRLAIGINNLAMLHRKRGDYEIAEPLYREALDLKRMLFGSDHPSVAVTLDGLGLIVQDMGKPELAEPYLREALSIRRQSLGENHPRVAGNLNNLANLLEGRGEFDQAIDYLQEAITIYHATVGNTHPWTVFPILGLSRIYMKQDRPYDAESLIRKALAIREEMLPSTHWQVAEVKSYLGYCLGLTGNFEEAESYLTDGYEALESELGADHHITRQSIQWLVALYDEWGKTDLATAYREVGDE
jgi:eukaryotic-like serine/threonine-protein kinase